MHQFGIEGFLCALSSVRLLYLLLINNSVSSKKKTAVENGDRIQIKLLQHRVSILFLWLPSAFVPHNTMKLHSAERTSLWHLKNTNTAALSTTLLRLYYKHFFLFNLFHSYLLTPHADGVSVTLRVVPLGELVIQQYALLKESQSPYYGPVLKGDVWFVEQL